MARWKRLLEIAFLFALMVFAGSAWAEPEIIGHEYGYSTLDIEVEASAIPMQAIRDLPIGIKDLPCPPSPYLMWEETKTTEYPARAIGKIFFTLDGKSYECSGALVDVDVVLTAGHCVVKKGKWYSKLYFAPGYRNGAPFGRHKARIAYAWKAWIYEGDWNYDYAMIVLDSSPGEAVGVLPTTWNESPYQLWWQAGYPGEPFTGGLLWFNEAATGLVADFAGAPAPIWTGTGSAPGCSGGPWFINKDGVLKINSVNSASLPLCDRMIQGPYFDSNFPRLLDLAKAYK